MSSVEQPGAAQPLSLGIVLARYPVLSETFIVRELLALWKQGVQLSIYAFGDSPDGKVHPSVHRLRVPVIILPGARRRAAIAQAFAFWARTRPLRLAESLLGTGAGELFRTAMGSLYLAREALRWQPHHFHAHFLSGPAVAARTMAILHGVSFSASAHAHDIYLSDPRELAARVRQAAWVRTVSRFNRRLLRGLVPDLPPRRVQVVRAGIEPSLYPFRRPRPHLEVAHIVSIGRLVPIKGMDVLLKAVSLIPPARWRLTIAGTGPLEASLRELAVRLGVAERVSFAGALVEEEVVRLLGEADIFVLACRRDETGNMDGLPSVLTEALASGVPSISTTVSGVPELLGGGAGILVPPDDAPSVAEAIQRLMDDPQLRLSLSLAGRRKVERWFDVARCSAVLRRRLERLVLARDTQP